MKRISLLFILPSFFAIAQIKTNLVLALPGDDSREFFQRGEEQMNQEIEILEEQQSEREKLEEKENNIEPGLEIRQEKPTIEEVSSPEERLELDNNEPVPSGHEEIRIDINQN